MNLRWVMRRTRGGKVMMVLQQQTQIMTIGEADERGLARTEHASGWTTVPVVADGLEHEVHETPDFVKAEMKLASKERKAKKQAPQ